MQKLQDIPATKLDIILLFELIGALAFKMTGEIPTVRIPEPNRHTPMAPSPEYVKWSKLAEPQEPCPDR
jgi:hypothetical protein